jgi:hypothetical protein
MPHQGGGSELELKKKILEVGDMLVEGIHPPGFDGLIRPMESSAVCDQVVRITPTVLLAVPSAVIACRPMDENNVLATATLGDLESIHVPTTYSTLIVQLVLRSKGSKLCRIVQQLPPQLSAPRSPERTESAKAADSLLCGADHPPPNDRSRSQ